MIALGLVVAVPVVLVAWAYAVRLGRRLYIEPPAAQVSEEEV